MKNPFIIASLLLCFGLTDAQPVSKTGKQLFESKCARCHGRDGTKGLFGAINLQGSRISDNEMFTTISNGRRFMPSWKKKLTEEEIRRISAYIKTLRK